MDNNNNSVNVKDLLPKELLEAISENGLATLQEAFDKLVESKVNEQIATAVKSAEVSLDAALYYRTFTCERSAYSFRNNALCVLNALSAYNPAC
jgi:hypothetical protein